jgi:hypothetical protein
MNFSHLSDSLGNLFAEVPNFVSIHPFGLIEFLYKDDISCQLYIFINFDYLYLVRVLLLLWQPLPAALLGLW